MEKGKAHQAGHSRALLFAALVTANRILSVDELKRLIGSASEAHCLARVKELGQFVSSQGLGLELEEVAGGFRLVVQAALIPELARLLSPPPLPQLSSAALETLALVAYQQPITRGELEATRGSSCASVLDTLQERELIRVVGRKDVVGKPLLYGTTEKFLLEFGLKSLEDLPPLAQNPTEFMRG